MTAKVSCSDIELPSEFPVPSFPYMVCLPMHACCCCTSGVKYNCVNKFCSCSVFTVTIQMKLKVGNEVLLKDISISCHLFISLKILNIIAKAALWLKYKLILYVLEIL